MSAGFIALFVATDGFGSGAFSGKSPGRNPGWGAPQGGNNSINPITDSGPEYHGHRVKLDYVPRHTQRTHMMDCYAIAQDGSKWKVSQGIFIKTDRE